MHTSMALNSLLEGIRSAGGESELICLPKLKIGRCRHCDKPGPGPCQTEGRCQTRDDFGLVVEKIRQADAAVFATPVYFADTGASLRALLSRLKRICEHPDGRRGVAGTPAVGVCIGGGAAHCATRLRGVLSSCGFQVLEVVTAPRRGLHLRHELLVDAGRRLAAAQPAFPAAESG